MLAVAQDLQGEAKVRALTEEHHLTFPVLVDRTSRLADLIGFKIVPSGVFLD